MSLLLRTTALVLAAFSVPTSAAPAAPAAATVAMPALVANYKFSALPVDHDRYSQWCRDKLTGKDGRPRTTDKCGPRFYPYVARPKSGDALMELIGKHDYTMNGHRYADLFSPPFEQKVAATFLVFRPMNRVVLVRVDDFDLVENEERDIMSQVYLSIVDGKVVDQIDDCEFDEKYRCLVDDRVVGVLGENGKLKRK